LLNCYFFNICLLGVIGICDPGSEYSVSELKKSRLGRAKKFNPNCVTAIICNKSDLNPSTIKEFNDQVDALNTSNDNKFKIYRVSAKLGDGVEKAFDDIIDTIYQNKRNEN